MNDNHVWTEFPPSTFTHSGCWCLIWIKSAICASDVLDEVNLCAYQWCSYMHMCMGCSQSSLHWMFIFMKLNGGTLHSISRPWAWIRFQPHPDQLKYINFVYSVSRPRWISWISAWIQAPQMMMIKSHQGKDIFLQACMFKFTIKCGALALIIGHQARCPGDDGFELGASGIVSRDHGHPGISYLNVTWQLRPGSTRGHLSVLSMQPLHSLGKQIPLCRGYHLYPRNTTRIPCSWSNCRRNISLKINSLGGVGFVTQFDFRFGMNSNTYKLYFVGLT